MPTLSEAETTWCESWSRQRQLGLNRFLIRMSVINGVLPGVVGAGLLMFVQPQVGGTNIGLPVWALVAFVLFSTLGFSQAWRWWSASERKFHALRS